MDSILVVLLAIGAMGAALWLFLHDRRTRRIEARLFGGSIEAASDGLDGSRDGLRSGSRDDPLEGAAGSGQESRTGGIEARLRLWLTRAGHRSPGALRAFGLACAGSTLLAALGTALLIASGLIDRVVEAFTILPVIGPGLGFLVGFSPWLFGLWMAALPVLLVRRDRERRVIEIEGDLPLVIELLATLAEAGLGFESAMAEVLAAQPRGRPLGDELRVYQLEVSAGEPRSESLRRLALRIDLPALSAFSSALIHGEQTGASVAGLLRPQARQIRQQRREQALARAESLPEKLVVPLLLGFLPGLLVWTLGPAFHQLFTMLDAAIG